MAENILVTGKRGTDHITSAQVGAINAAMMGDGVYLSEGFEVTMTNANTASIKPGVIIINGRASVIETTTTLTIQSGMTARNRNDLIVARYVKDSSSLTEETQLKVITGTPTTATASDPVYTKGNILDGALVVEAPLYRVEIRGIATPTLVPLCNRIPTLNTLGQSVAAYPKITVVSNTWGSVIAARVGSVVTVKGSWTSSASSWQNEIVGRLPEEYRPPFDIEVPMARANRNQYATGDVGLFIKSNGEVRIYGYGGSAKQGDYMSTTCSYVVL